MARGGLADSPRARNARPRNLAQTSTYLHVDELGLEESMKRFDDFRGKTVVKEGDKELRPVGHETDASAAKDLLH
jgi:hypothetical protein